MFVFSQSERNRTQIWISRQDSWVPRTLSPHYRNLESDATLKSLFGYFNIHSPLLMANYFIFIAFRLLVLLPLHFFFHLEISEGKNGKIWTRKGYTNFTFPIYDSQIIEIEFVDNENEVEVPRNNVGGHGFVCFSLDVNLLIVQFLFF